MPNFRLQHHVRWMSLAAIGACALIGQNVLAQESTDSWKFSAGLGVINQPKYPGSGDTKTSALPMLSANYGRYFMGGLPGAGIPMGAGAYVVRDPHFQLGIGLGSNLDNPRKESDSARLAGLGDIDATVMGSVFASYSDSWWRVGGYVVTDLGGKNQGTRATLDLEGKYQAMDKLQLTAGPSVTWVSSDYNQTFFGIDAAQSARSGRPTYTPQSGVNSVSFHIGANYQLTSQWGLGARLNTSSLRGDAADSPITEDKTQTSFGLFANYRF